MLKKSAIAAGVISALLIGSGVVWWLYHWESVTFEDFAADKAQLIDGVESYLRVTTFLEELDKRAITYEIDRPGNSAGPSRPRFDVTTVTIRRFSNLGYSGELNISFFNDRLMATSFYPLDSEGYRQ